MGDMSKVFVTRDGVLYVQEDGGEPRPARLGERFTYVLNHSHRRLWPYGRQQPRWQDGYAEHPVDSDDASDA
jgi:hypothetical protein